ncbi:unnamed protein product [Scytosiphon promiscuus]
MLQDGVPALYRKPSLRPERGERRASRVLNGSLLQAAQKDDDGSNPDQLRGVLEIQPASVGKGKDAGPSLFGKRTPSSKAGGDSYRLLYVSACSVAFVNAMTFSVLGPFLPAYISGRFGSTTTQVGMIMAAYPAINLATSPLVGWLMNRYGRWKSLLAGLVILAFATGLYGIATSVTGLYVASGLHGASLSFIHVSSLGLLSAFPERLTESMAGIEIWSGVAQILGPPLGCLVVPYGGVSSIFLLVAMFPVCLIFLSPRISQLVRSGKGEGDFGDTGQEGGSLSLWKAARSRGVLAGAFVTAYNYGVIGFLEVTLAPHLAQTLSTSPRSIGFVLVLPNVLYTVTAMKAEDIVDRHGVRRTLLWGLCIMSASLVMYGPSPALAPALVTRGAARGAIGAGLLAFQVGSALASVPAFTAMQAGVAGMGTGADDMVASAHAMSIGVGEVIGPMLGGYVVELLPTSLAFACEPDAPIMQLHEPVFQLGGELRPHLSSSSSKDHFDGQQRHDGENNNIPLGEEEYTDSSLEVLLAELKRDAAEEADLRAGKAGDEPREGGGVEAIPPALGEGGGKNRRRRLPRREAGRGAEGGAAVRKQEQSEAVASEEGEGNRSMVMGAGRGGPRRALRTARSDAAPDRLAEGGTALKISNGEARRWQQQQQQRLPEVVFPTSRRDDAGRRRASADAQGGAEAASEQGDVATLPSHAAGTGPVAESVSPSVRTEEGPRSLVRDDRRVYGGAGAVADGRSLDIEGSGDNAARTNDLAGLPDVEHPPGVEREAREEVAGAGGGVVVVVVDGDGLADGGDRLEGGAGVGGEGAAAADAAAAGGGNDGVGDDSATVDLVEAGDIGAGEDGEGEGPDGGADSCESAFPLATTLLAWASGFAVLLMFRLLPAQAGSVKGHGAGLPS